MNTWIASPRTDANTIPVALAPRPGHFVRESGQWLGPIQYSARTLYSWGTDPAVYARVQGTLERLTPDAYSEFLLDYYRQGQQQFGSHWQFADLLSILQGVAMHLQPRNYLEIGVRRGRSLALVASAAPNCHLYGFDLWVENYSGMENPGPDFVRSEVRRLAPQARVELFSGNSHETVPEFLAANPDLKFDLINVDGDHSEPGARTDLLNVLPALAVGGVLVLDDIAHPQHRYLEQVWDRHVASRGDMSCGKFSDLGFGVAWGVRIS